MGHGRHNIEVDNAPSLPQMVRSGTDRYHGACLACASSRRNSPETAQAYPTWQTFFFQRS